MLRTNLATRPFYNEGAVRLVLLGLGLVVVAATLFNVARVIQLSRRDTQLVTQASRDEARATELGLQPLGSAEPWIPRPLSAPRPKPVRPTA